MSNRAPLHRQCFFCHENIETGHHEWINGRLWTHDNGAHAQHQTKCAILDKPTIPWDTLTTPRPMVE